MPPNFGWPSMFAAAGAGAYAFKNSENYGVVDMVRGVSKSLGISDGSASRGSLTSTHADMAGLKGELDSVRNLILDMARNKQQAAGYHIIHTGRNNWNVFGICVVAGGLCYCYLWIRGYPVGSIFPVTRGALSALQSTVTESLNKVWAEVRKQKEEIFSKLGLLGRKQEELITAQTAMDERLQQVGGDVGDIKATTSSIGNRVEELDSRLADVYDGVQRSNQGIILLCAAVHEVTNKIGMQNNRSSQALKTYLHTAPALGSSGLKGLIDAADIETLPALPALPTQPTVPSSNSSFSGAVAGSGSAAAGMASGSSMSFLHYPSLSFTRK